MSNELKIEFFNQDKIIKTYLIDSKKDILIASFIKDFKSLSINGYWTKTELIQKIYILSGRFKDEILGSFNEIIYEENISYIFILSFILRKYNEMTNKSSSIKININKI